MNPLKLLAVIASAGVIGSAQAIDTTFSLGALSPTVRSPADSPGASNVSPPYSFMDIPNFAFEANYRTVSASAVKYAPGGTGVRPARIADPRLDSFPGADAVSSLSGIDGSLDSTRNDLKAAVSPGGVFARKSLSADTEPAGRFRFSATALPEPDDWMTLLCGLVVMGFMARRKTDLLAG